MSNRFQPPGGTSNQSWDIVTLFFSMSSAPSLWEEATKTSGISRDRGERATKLQPSIFSRHGDAFFAALATAFYDRAYSDNLFRELFANTYVESLSEGDIPTFF